MLPAETWIASAPASSSHRQTCTESSIVFPRSEPEEERVRVLGGADLHLQVEVVADLAADRAHRLEQQARPVLERPAVLVLAVVDRRGEELREEVAVGAVDLDAVEARLAGAAAAAANEPVISS